MTGISPDDRKLFAAFYTTEAAAHFLARLAINRTNLTVLDPACGEGSLLVAAVRRLIELGGTEFPNDQTTSNQIAEILGVEVMPEAAILARTRIQDAIPIEFKDTIRSDIQIADATSLPPIAADIVIMNPPFTRGVNLAKLSNRIKKNARDSKDSEKNLKDHLSRHADLINKRMGLHGYFLLLADDCLRENRSGIMAAVLPAGTLRAGSLEKIREFLVKNYSIQYLIARNDQSAFSENTSLREILFIAKRREKKRETKNWVSIVMLHHFPESDREQVELVDVLELARKQYKMQDNETSLKVPNEHQTPGFSQIFLDQQQLRESCDNWYRFFTSMSELGTLWRDCTRHLSLVKSETIISNHDIIRGVESPRFSSIASIVISDPKFRTGRERWYFSGQDTSSIQFYEGDLPSKKNLKIPKVGVLRCIKSFAGLPTLHVDMLQDFLLLDLTQNPREVIDEIILDNSSKDLESAIESWKSHVQNRVGTLFHVRRIDLSAPGSIHLAYRSSQSRVATKLFWVLKCPDWDSVVEKGMALWFNSSFHLLQILLNRAETRGAFIEISKQIMSTLEVPNPTRLIELSPLIEELYAQVRDLDFPSLIDQLQGNFEGRVKIDEFFLRNFSKGLVGSLGGFGTKIRDVLALEVLQLKNMMQAD